MVNPDTPPLVHTSLENQLAIARLELTDIASGLWQVVGYNKDVIAEALSVFPTPAQRRSDTQFTCEPENEEALRSKAAVLGPGRKETESLEDLGVYTVDAEVIEPGQLHKTVTEIWRSLISANQAPIIVFASDRSIPLWVEGKENEQVDAERLSTYRLMTVGGKGIAASADFFYRAGRFDAQAELNAANHSDLEATWAEALELPNTEYDVTERFLGSALDEVHESVLSVGYDPESGQLLTDKTGQIRRLGTIGGRDIVLVHKTQRKDGTPLDTTDTILLMGELSANLTATPETVISYWTSATYKPSRWMSGIRASIQAARKDMKLKVTVPTYGYADLSKVKGEQNPTPPTIQNIAGEIAKAAQEAFDLRALLDSLN